MGEAQSEHQVRGLYECLGSEEKQALLKLLADSELQTIRETNQAGQAAIKCSLLINGGAAVALLAFLGSLSAGSANAASGVSIALLLFVAGVLFAAMGSGCAYLSLYLAAGDRNGLDLSRAREQFRRWNRGTIELVTVSYAAFIGAGVVAYFALV